MNVVLNFHKGDQMSAKVLMELLLVVDEGIDCTYYLQYGDPTSTIEIRDTLTKFLNRKNAHFSNELPNITIPQDMVDNDPNSVRHQGNHRIKSRLEKMSILGWNLCVFKYIYALDSFLMIEPDCCILKQNWLREIYEGYKDCGGPIFGHLKRGKIRGEYVPTHWAGCSVYNSPQLRDLSPERYFYERYDNPWWTYRNEEDTEMPNNCFWGPAFSGYDISYDYFLFGLYWREKTGINDPFHWPMNEMEDSQHLIFCDFRTKLSADEIFDKFANRLPLMHGIKSDEIRHHMIKYFATRGSAVRTLPLSGHKESSIRKSNSVSANRSELEERASVSGASSLEGRSPIVSIVIPAFNAATFIGKAIESVQAQSLADWEALVVNDGSTDNTQEVVAKLAGTDSRIRLLRCKGKGVSDARNTGLDAARGEFITFLDADDFMYPDALKRRVEALRNNTGWHLVHCATEVVDANSRKLRWQLGCKKEVSFKDMRSMACHINSLLGCSQVVKSARFESGLKGEDWLFLSDLLRSGEVSHRVDNCSVAYAIRSDSQVIGDYPSYQNEVLKVLDMIYSPVRKNLPAAPEFAQGLSWPPKETVALHRRTGCLTWLLLEQRANDAAALLGELSAEDLSGLRSRALGDQITYPAMRFYACTQEELCQRLRKDKAALLRLISETGIENTFPQYADEFKSLMEGASTSKTKRLVDSGLSRKLADYPMMRSPTVIAAGRFILNRLGGNQHREMKAITNSVKPDPFTVVKNGCDEREKQARWRTIKNLYRGQRAFIVGNGPSLNKTPLHLLQDEFTLCFNRFDLMFERLGWRPTMYMCIDDRVAESTASRINETVPLVKYAFFPDIHPWYGLDFRDFIKDAPNVCWLSLKSVHDPTGSYETLPTCSTRGTVAHLGLQVLAFMGFSPIYLVGVDMDYKEHKTVENPGQQKWTATKDDDPNHFDPRYFGTGAKYYRPSNYKLLISGFECSKGLLDRKGISVLNAGIGGSLEAFPRVDFRTLFNFKEDAELERLLSAVPSRLRRDALRALRADKVVEVQDDWDQRSLLQVTTLQLAEQLIPKSIFTHIPYGPFGNRYLFIRREKALDSGADKGRKVASVAPMKVGRIGERRHRKRPIDYLKRNYPVIITLGRIVKWSLSTLRKAFLGLGGISLVVIVGLYIAGVLVEPLRWYLVGIASALLVLGGGLLALSYVRLIFGRFTADQRRGSKAIDGRLNHASRDRAHLWAALEERKKEFSDSIKAMTDILELSSKDRTQLWVAVEQPKKQVSESAKVITDLLELASRDRIALQAGLEQLKKEFSESIKAMTDVLEVASSDRTQLWTALEQPKKQVSESAKVIADLLELASRDRIQLHAAIEQLKKEVSESVKVIDDRLIGSSGDRTQLRATLERLQKEISGIKDDVFLIGYDLLKEQNKLLEKVYEFEIQATNDRRGDRPPNDSSK